MSRLSNRLSGMFGRLAAMFVIAAVFVGTTSACTRAQGPQAGDPLQVTAFRIGADQPDRADRSFPVVIQREREAALGSRLTGILSAVRVKVGDRLRKGSVVAAIRAEDVRAERTRISAARNELRSRVARQQSLLAIGAISKAELEASQAELRAVEASLSAADFDIRSAVVEMPFDGVVLSVQGEVGEVSLPGKSIARVADITSPIIARAKIPEGVAQHLRRGQMMQISVPGRDGPLDAQLLRVGLQSDPRTGTVDVDFALPAYLNSLASGAIGSVRVPDASQSFAGEGQRVPIEALLEIEGEAAYIYVVDSKTRQARRTKARLLGVDTDWIRICCLPLGSVVIVDGAGFVKDHEVVAPRLL